MIIKLISKNKKTIAVNYSDLELNKITDNKQFWKTIKPLLSDKCTQSPTISLVDNNNVISDDSELAKKFNSYFEKAVANLGIKEYESLDTNPGSASQDDVDIAISKYKNHPSIKMINKNVSFESRFSFKDISESDILKEISNLNSKKVGTLGNTKVLKESSNACNTVLRDIWNFEILRKQNFPQNLKLADITPVYKKKDPTLAENCRLVSVLLSVSKIFERII